jgi:hypothetical protein
MKTTPAKVEVSLKFNQVPSVRSLAGGRVAFDREAENGTVFTVDIKAKSWKKVKDSMAEFPQWVARVSGKLGNKTEKGFELEGAGLQVFEVQPREEQSSSTTNKLGMSQITVKDLK